MCNLLWCPPWAGSREAGGRCGRCTGPSRPWYRTLSRAAQWTLQWAVRERWWRGRVGRTCRRGGGGLGGLKGAPRLITQLGTTDDLGDQGEGGGGRTGSARSSSGNTMVSKGGNRCKYRCRQVARCFSAGRTQSSDSQIFLRRLHKVSGFLVCERRVWTWWGAV